MVFTVDLLEAKPAKKPAVPSLIMEALARSGWGLMVTDNEGTIIYANRRYSARTRVANKQRQSLSEVFGKTSNASALPLQNINDTPNAMPVNPASIDKKPVSRQWSIWIKKIYEVDPLICKKCGSQMKIVGFIHNSREIKKNCRTSRTTRLEGPAGD